MVDCSHFGDGFLLYFVFLTASMWITLPATQVPADQPHLCPLDRPSHVQFLILASVLIKLIWWMSSPTPCGSCSPSACVIWYMPFSPLSPPNLVSTKCCLSPDPILAFPYCTFLSSWLLSLQTSLLKFLTASLPKRANSSSSET